jgi:hypothetical protein
MCNGDSIVLQVQASAGVPAPQSRLTAGAEIPTRGKPFMQEMPQEIFRKQITGRRIDMCMVGGE